MADKQASAAAKKPPAEDILEKKEQDAAMAGYFANFLREYRPVDEPVTYDTVDNHYKVKLDEPLPQLNTKTANAYNVINLVEPENQSLYALVCLPGSVPRYDVIERLMQSPHPHLICPVAYDVVHLSQGNDSRLVIIHEKPQGQTLTEFLSKAAAPSEEYIIRNFITPLANVIHHMEKLGVSHGCINPNNIYVKTKVVLGECVTEPCGYSQPFTYEPLERIQAHPAGKGSMSSTDYYSLGVVVLFTLYGAKHFDSASRETMIKLMLHEGMYYALTHGKSHPEAFDDFLRGTLHDQRNDRWGWKQLQPWISGKRFNVLPPPSPTANTRPFEYNGKEIYTRRELAESFFNDWINIPAALQSNQFLHWINVSLRNKPLAENISRTIGTMSQLTIKDDLLFNEHLMRIILMLDPDGPIRMYPLSFYPDGLTSLYMEYFKNEQQKELNLLVHFLEQNMVMSWVNMQAKEDTDDEEEDTSSPVYVVLSRLDKMRVCLRNTGPGFGSERILYELEPEMPCLSPLLQGKYVDKLDDLLIELDRLSPSLIGQKSTIDNHIFAFLASKLGIQHSIRLRELENIPDLANNRECIALRLIAMAQYRCGNISLPGLSHFMALQLIPVFGKIRSRTIRTEIHKKLRESAATGYVQVMAKEMLDSAYIEQDYRGYIRAYNNFHQNIGRIISLQKGEFLMKRSDHLGVLIAKFAAYSIFCITLFALMRGGSI